MLKVAACMTNVCEVPEGVGRMPREVFNNCIRRKASV